MDDTEMKVFQIISISGDSRAQAFEALRMARKGQFDAADAKMEEARKTSAEVHNLQTDMLTEEARGNKTPVGLLMVHAQDHLMTSLLARDLIEEMIGMLKDKQAE